MPHQSPDLPPPKPEAVARALAFCRARGSFIFREVQTEFNFGRDELIAVMNVLFRGDFIEKHGPVRDGQPEWRMKPGAPEHPPAPGADARSPSASVPSVSSGSSVPAGAKPWDPKRYGAKDSSHPQVRFWSTTSGMLYWAAAVLGLACMIDTLRQSTSFGLWPPFEPLYYFYYPVLTAYAAARDKEKRVRRAKEYERRMGEVFFSGWGAVLIFIWLYDWANNSVFYPRTLEPTIAVVLSVFAGVKIAGAVWPIVPFDPDNPNDPDAPPQPAPGPRPAPGPDPTPTPGQDDHARFAAACQRLGTFRAEDLVQDQGCSIHVAGGWIGQFIKEGLIRRGPDGRYQWLAS
ncbi:MAG TPA: hypothetical protein VNK24_08860 [Elusimicrobiota bacterium]|nr:hypothetical protein [Elusimicrobiota bacterium]